MKLKMRPTTTFNGTIESVSIREVVNFRIWWKPWTWRRQKIYLEYDSMVYPYTPDMPSDWKGGQWIITDNKMFKRIIYRDCITHEHLETLQFCGDINELIIFPYEAKQ